MNEDEDKQLCAYCGTPALTGAEEPEHIFPAAINGRLTTRTVCVSCNRAAGREIDQPWLTDPFVLDLRFSQRIPDRRGNVLERSPMLTGMTDDGRRVTMRPDGTPVQMNTPVKFDEQTGEYTISAGDQAALDDQLEKQRRKAEKQAKAFTAVSRGRRQISLRFTLRTRPRPGLGTGRQPRSLSHF